MFLCGWKRRKTDWHTSKNDPSYGLEDEAIRVLKSLKTKWIPGKNQLKASTNFLQIAHHITNELSFNNKAESRNSALLLR
jgi:hypothetical protein